jgi:hypothetical protein
MCLAVIVTFAASVPLFSQSAHAQQQGFVTVDKTWLFDSAPGHCDSVYQPDGSGGCAVEDWWTGGRVGYDTVSTNGYLWLSNDQSWNSWNAFFNPSGFGATQGRCNISGWIFAGTSGEVGEVDLWENNGSSLTFLASQPIFGTNNT